MQPWLDTIVRALLPRVVPLLVAAAIGGLATVGLVPPELAACIQEGGPVVGLVDQVHKP
jgi:hypothetical protein